MVAVVRSWKKPRRVDFAASVSNQGHWAELPDPCSKIHSWLLRTSNKQPLPFPQAYLHLGTLSSGLSCRLQANSAFTSFELHFTMLSWAATCGPLRWTLKTFYENCDSAWDVDQVCKTGMAILQLPKVKSSHLGCAVAFSSILGSALPWRQPPSSSKV